VDDLSEADADNETPTNMKPPATRVTLEVASLTKMMDELCKCPECGGPLDFEIKTTCIASHAKATCLDRNCGCILHGDPPAPTTTHELKETMTTTTELLIMQSMHCTFLACSVMEMDALRQPAFWV